MITHFGIDIGSVNIEAVQVVKEKTGYKLTNIGIIGTPGNGLLSDSEKDLANVAEAIKKLKKDCGIKSSEVVASISERNVFTKLIEMPKMNKEELVEAIPWEAENIIPQPLAQVNLDWEIVSEDKAGGKMKVFLVAAPITLINKYLTVLKLAGLEPMALENESTSMARCLSLAVGTTNMMMVDFGVKSAEVTIVKNSNIYLTRSVSNAGEAITRAIGSSLNLELNVAEEYKKNYGLTPQFEGKVAQAAQTVVSVVVGEMKKAIKFFEENEQGPLKLVMLNGGTALLPGISEYLAKEIGIEVQIADPLSLLKIDPQIQQQYRQISPLFTIACGLAMREI